MRHSQFTYSTIPVEEEKPMQKNPLKTIQEFKQSIWQDDLQRKMLLSGELQELIEQDGIRGITSNPSIFAKGIAGSSEYDSDIEELAQQGCYAEEIYEFLTLEDVQMAADLFRPLYDSSDGRFGFVSLEVNPHLARNIDGTIEEARRLWQALLRPNVMIKVPATKEGVTCIEQLTSEGLNINVTLFFGLTRYREVAEAYLRGLESRMTEGAPLDSIVSVASFFLSRIDVLIDPVLKNIKRDFLPGAEIADKIFCKVAIASAKCAYMIYREMCASERFEMLQKKEHVLSSCCGPVPVPRNRNSAISNTWRR